MGMFGNIVSALFHHAPAAAPEQTASAATASDPAPAGEGTATPPAGGAPAAPGAPTTPDTAAPASAGGAAPQTVDAKAVLAGLAAKNPQKLDWQHSIVDMMKLLGLDSSLANRKELAQELHYSGNMEDSAQMNMWLHGEVMKKLAENGGQVPADLKA